MMVELVRARNPGNLLKTQIVRVRLLKREDHVNEVLSQVGDVCDAFPRRGYTDHRFGGMQGDTACPTELSDKMVKELKGVIGFSPKEIIKRFFR